MNILNKKNIFIKKYSYGRNNKGRITIRGRQSTLYTITKPRNKNYTYIYKHIINKNYLIKDGLYAKIINISNDPKTRQNLYQICFLNSILIGSIKFIPITKKTSIGDIIVFGTKASIHLGNILPILNLPLGSYIHNIESIKNSGAVFVKNSKKSAYIHNIGVKYATIKLPSGKLRLISKYLFCIYGELMYTNFKENINKFKAGFTRHIGRRPKVRGVAMNACDHPHGGGEGKSPIGRKNSYTPWGKLFRGVKTRLNKKYSSKYVLNN